MYYIKCFVTLCFISKIICLDTTVPNMISSFLIQDEQPTSILAPYLCWNKHQLTRLAKTLNDNGISFATSFQNNRNDNSLEHLVFLADLNCLKTQKFLKKANKYGYFKSPYRWLILNYLHKKSNRSMVEDLHLFVDSDVVLVQRNGSQTYEFVEVYKVSSNSELIYTTRGKWRPKNTYLKNVNTINYTEIEKFSTRRIGNAALHNSNSVLEDYRESKVLSSRRNNLMGHTFVMGNVIIDSNETKRHLGDRLHLHHDAVAKSSYSIVNVCFQALNATEKMLFTKSWGYRDKNGSWTGLVGLIITKKADIGTISLFTHERIKVIDFVSPDGATSLKFVFRKPPLSSISNIFVQPFSRTVWTAISVCVLGCSIFLYVTSKWEASVSMNQFQLDGSWADVIILTIGAVLQQGCTLEPRFAAGRTVTLLLFLALTILYSAYAANIVVLLRAPSSAIRTLSDLLTSQMELGASDFDYNKHYFKTYNDSVRKAIYEKKIAPKGQKPHYYTMKEGVERIRKGLFAFHMETNPGYRIMQETYQEGEKCDLVEVDYFNEIGTWIPAQKRSPFKDLFKVTFLKIREYGIQSCLHHRLRVSRPKCYGSVSTFSSIGITDMYLAMLVTLYGALVAPLVLLLEMTYFRLTKMRRFRTKQ